MPSSQMIEVRSCFCLRRFRTIQHPLFPPPPSRFDQACSDVSHGRSHLLEMGGAFQTPSLPSRITPSDPPLPPRSDQWVDLHAPTSFSLLRAIPPRLFFGLAVSNYLPTLPPPFTACGVLSSIILPAIVPSKLVFPVFGNACLRRRLM